MATMSRATLVSSRRSVAFALLKGDGSVATWGAHCSGGRLGCGGGCGGKGLFRRLGRMKGRKVMIEGFKCFFFC